MRKKQNPKGKATSRPPHCLNGIQSRIKRSVVALPTLLSSTATIRFQDCDPYGHLFNSKYIDYFLNAREDQVSEHYGLNIYGLALTEGIGWVVGQNQIAYFKPAGLMEKVVITSRLIHYSKGTIKVEFQMLDSKQTHVKAFMWSSFVHFNLKEKAAAVHDQRFMDMFAQAHLPVEEQTYQERALALKKQVLQSTNA